jgi:flavin-dependent dehydrogenase
MSPTCILEPTENDSLPSATGVTSFAPQSQIRSNLKSKIVIDATGTNALLSKKLNLKKSDPKLKKASLFAHYKGAARDPNPRDVGATLVLSTKDQDGWFWYIPLPDDIVSVGVVGDIDRLITSRNGKSPSRTLE